MHNSREYAQFQRICKIPVNLHKSSKSEKFQRICKNSRESVNSIVFGRRVLQRLWYCERFSCIFVNLAADLQKSRESAQLQRICTTPENTDNSGEYVRTPTENRTRLKWVYLVWHKSDYLLARHWNNCKRSYVHLFLYCRAQLAGCRYHY